MSDPFGYDYPAGTRHDPRAPWNQEEPVETEYEVTCRIWVKVEGDDVDAMRTVEALIERQDWDIEVLRVEKEI